VQRAFRLFAVNHHVNHVQGGFMTADMRAYSRAPAVPHAYAGIGGGLTWLGALQDISPGGLSFEYIAQGARSADDAPGVSVFLANEEFHLSGLPCAVVYDIPAVLEGAAQGLPPGFAPRRCGLRFGALNRQQRLQLGAFIDRCASAAPVSAHLVV
jgi:hypothetical protein